MCDHCLAPDTSSGAGIGCDNMTIMIIALLHGRTKEEWYAWVTDRVKNNYGYETSAVPPRLYAESRLVSFRVRKEATEAREKARAERGSNGGGDSGSNSYGTTFGGLARVLGSTGGISFNPGSGILSDTGTLMFGNDDSDDESGDDDDMDADAGQSFFSNTLGIGRPESPDPTRHLKAKLDEFEKDMREEDGTEDEDFDSSPEASSSTPHLQGEAPPPPAPLPNGNAPVEQLKYLPGGDEPSPAVMAEGLLDSSESPLKV